MAGSNTWVAFLLTVALLELTPGPNMGYLAALTVQHGRPAGFAAIFGITLGLLVYLGGSVLGLTEIIGREPALYEVLRWAGVGYMLWMAWDAWREASDADVAVLPPIAPVVLAWRGFLANILNPKVAMFYVTLLPAFVPETAVNPAASAFGLGCVHVAVSIAVHIAIVLAAGQAAAALAGGGARLVMVRRGLAAGLVAIAVWLGYATRLV